MLEWNVFYYNPNTKKLEKTNILYHREKDIANLKQKSSDRSEFSEELRSEMMYHYWGRCEWETIITPWPPSAEDKEWKVDVFWQLDLNWRRFVDYCWNNV